MVNFQWDNLFKKHIQGDAVTNALKENILFKSLTKRELGFLETIVHERHFRAGETIFRQGELGVGMYVVVKGSVDIFVRDRQIHKDDPNKDLFVTRLEKDDFFGELSLVEDNGRRNATAIAFSDTIVVGFFKPDLMSLLERSPATGVKVVYKLAEVLGKRLRDTTDKISHLKAELKTLNHINNENKEGYYDPRTNYSP